MCETKMKTSSNLLRGISKTAASCSHGIDSTAIVRRMEQLHKTSAVTTAALGRLLTGVAMMGQMLTGFDSVTVQIKGAAARRVAYSAVSTRAGDVKRLRRKLHRGAASARASARRAVGKDGTLM